MSLCLHGWQERLQVLLRQLSQTLQELLYGEVAGHQALVNSLILGLQIFVLPLQL